MRFLRAMLGFLIAAVMVTTLWGEFVEFYGIVGGWIAAFIIIGPMWLMNHYLELIPNDKDAAFVDMGLGIAVCGVVKGTLIYGMSGLLLSLPTLAYVVIGAVVGAVTAVAVEKEMTNKKVNKQKQVLQQVSKVRAFEM